MPSKPTERSIASQLVLLFTPAAGLILLGGLAVLYWIVVQHTLAEDNAALADKLSSVVNDLREMGGPAALAEEMRESRGRTKTHFASRLLDANGATIAETPGLATVVPPSAFLQIDPAARRPRDVRTHGRLFSLATTAADVNGRHYTIQIAQDRSEDDRFRRRFGLLTMIVLAAGLAASAVAATTVTRRGLRPLHEITRAIERVDPAHLRERVAARDWPRELQPLAAAFDAMLARLEASFTRLSQFSSDLAHELRTPLTNMLGEAQVALTRSRTPEEYRDVLESHIVECERLKSIVENLLFVARAENAERIAQRERFDARAAVEDLVSYYSAAAEERQISLTCEGQAQIDADRMLFHRALANLIDNSLQFTAKGGRIRVTVASADRTTQLRVEDNGSGIPPEHLLHVFDRFYRVDSARSSTGTGLGLAIVKSIAELHGGLASVESTPGGGTTVRLTFPGTPAKIPNL